MATTGVQLGMRTPREPRSFSFVIQIKRQVNNEACLSGTNLYQLECDGSFEPISDLAGGGFALKHAGRGVIMEVGFRSHATSALMADALALWHCERDLNMLAVGACIILESTRIPSRLLLRRFEFHILSYFDRSHNIVAHDSAHFCRANGCNLFMVFPGASSSSVFS